ncbi:MAG: metallophosphoesterase [Anaerovoracaceae bacterium]
MEKIIGIIDTHLRASNPKSRLDNFPETMKRKIKWVYGYAEEIGARAVLHGGDWTESPDISNSYLSEIMEIVSSSTVPTFSVLGNHDVYGQNPETFKKTPLGIAVSSGAFRLLNPNTPVFIGGFAITGSHYFAEIDGNLKSAYIDNTVVDNFVNINVVHGFLDDHRWMDGVKHTVISDIADFVKSDITITGHIHSGYGIIEHDGKIFCNPNALARTTASVGDVNNTVQILEITIADDGSFYAELIPLPDGIVESADKVLDRDKLEQEKANKKRLETFISSINAEIDVVGSAFNMYDALDNIAKENKIDGHIKKLAIEQLSIAEEQGKGGIE